MASIAKRGKRWRAEVYCDGRRSAKSFDTIDIDGHSVLNDCVAAGVQFEFHRDPVRIRASEGLSSPERRARIRASATLAHCYGMLSHRYPNDGTRGVGVVELPDER